jgi:hypothetical protein
MRRKSTKYDTPDAGGWMNVCDDLFLAQFRGRPCEVCGRTHVVYNNRNTRSCGHHLLSKALHRTWRYEPRNIVILCADHHGHHSRDISPHSDDTAAVAAFYAWLIESNPYKWKWMRSHTTEIFDKSWKYRDKYVELGGEVQGELVKDQKPLNHSAKIRVAEEV